MSHDIRIATGLIKLWMRLWGFTGWSSLWGAIYVMPGFQHNKALIRHEAMHLEQMRRDGKARFMARYAWWTLRYGYQDNPYEAEARKAAEGAANE